MFVPRVSPNTNATLSTPNHPECVVKHKNPLFPHQRQNQPHLPLPQSSSPTEHTYNPNPKMSTTPTSLLFSPSTPPASTRSASATEETPCPRPRSFSNPGSSPRRNLTLTRRRSQNNSTRRRENGSALLYTSPPMETRSRACSSETVIHHSISPSPSVPNPPKPDDNSSRPHQPINLANKPEVTRRQSLPLLNTTNFPHLSSNRSPTATTPIAPQEKDRLELVYNLLTSTFRFEWRSKLLPDAPLSPLRQFPFPGSLKGSSTQSQNSSKPTSRKLQKRASVNLLSSPHQPLLRKPKSTGNLLSTYNSNSLRGTSSIRSQIAQNSPQVQGSQQAQTQSPPAPLLQMDHRTPPLLVDGRRTIIPIPKFQRTLKIYWRRGLDKRALPTHTFPSQNVKGTTTCGTVPTSNSKLHDRLGPRGETEVLVRRVKIPGKIWFERNFMGRWGECWVERC